MKPRLSKEPSKAFARVEVLMILTVVGLLFCLSIAWLIQARHRAGSICCNCNLKQIGLSFRVWEGDQGDKYPMQISVTNGGSMEMVAAGNVAQNFLVMSNELGTPRVLHCPEDKTHTVANLFHGLANFNVSYFVGVDVIETDPQALLSGDGNFEISGVPIRPGLLELSSNTPIAWSAARHKFRGNIGLADGSVQSANNSTLTNWLQQTGLATNRLAIP